MKSSLDTFEKIVIKRLRKDGFGKPKKLDKEYKTIKAPDFLFLHNKDNYQFLAEVKKNTKCPGNLRETKENIPGNQLNCSIVVYETLEEINEQRGSLVKRHNQYSKLPYVFFVFDCTWLWNRFGFLDHKIYKNFPYISAVFRQTEPDPKEFEWRNLSPKKLEHYYKKYRSQIESREIYEWEVVINKYAKNKLEIRKFSEVKIIRNGE